MGLAVPLSLYLTIIALAKVAQAALPWNSQISQAALKTADGVAFDPLSLLAILWNPRASASAARLYMRSDQKRLRWPHMMQIGAVTVPVYMLVNHLISNYQSIHPGLDMCQASIDMLDVKSTIGSVRLGSDGSFSKLPVATGDSTLIKALNFKPSQSPTNDMMVVYLAEPSTNDASQPSMKAWVGANLVLCTEIIMGLIILSGTIFSALLGDIWAVALFGSYLFHWLASTAISFRYLVVPDRALRIQKDEKTAFAVYNRPSGGLIVFKGTQTLLERWARTKWVFNSNPLNTFFHWAWMVTGTAAAFASQACMVNMSGSLQLGFIGILLYSSVAELWLTVVANELPTDTFHRTLTTRGVEMNDRRYKSIIQLSLGLDRDHRLDELRWIDLGLLPGMTVFQAMVTTLDYLNQLDAQKGPVSLDSLVDAKVVFDDGCKTLREKDFVTRDGIWLEIQRVWELRQAEETKMLQVGHV